MDVIIDSQLDKETALKQNPAFPCPEHILHCQQMIDVFYYSFDGKIHRGQVVVHEDVVADIRQVFALILKHRFPITSAIPVADPRFHWDDDLTMEAGNASGFNYRTIARTTRLSHHAYGRAIDINPRQNPYITKDFSKPLNALYNVEEPGTIRRGDVLFATFEALGWLWGGDWEDRKDYQHFEKPLTHAT
ncbi:MAG TPA: M15 family metallopeptidase [Ktedonobacteraceae bacterium]|jgi:hypothetical protein